MSIKVTVPNNSGDYLTFGSANTPTSAQIGGYDDGSSNGHLEFYTTASGTSTERMRITSAGNVGIGVTNPGNKMAFPNNSYIGFMNTSGNEVGYIGMNSSNLMSYSDKFYTDSSGNLLMGLTTGLQTLSSRPCYQVSNSDGWGWIARNSNATAGNYWDLQIGSTNTVYILNHNSAGVQMANGATSWSSYSDIRLKNVTGSFTNALNDVIQLEPIKFTWKSDESNTPRVGLSAQSVEKVLPEAVDSGTLPNNEDTTEYLSVRYTDVIPLLVASIKELKAELDTVKTELATLKGQA